MKYSGEHLELKQAYSACEKCFLIYAKLCMYAYIAFYFLLLTQFMLYGLLYACKFEEG